MKATRKRYSADFTAKVAREAIRDDLTLAELAAKHGVHHTMIASWKRQAIDGMASTFSGAGDAVRAASESEVEKLHAKIGQLVAIMDWATRKVLAWRLSNMMDAGFCVAALEEALARSGTPEIFNTDQGRQFTSFAFTRVRREAEVRISMDGQNGGMNDHRD